MKIGMKDMAVAEEMALLVLASRTHRARICVLSAPDSGGGLHRTRSIVT